MDENANEIDVGRCWPRPFLLSGPTEIEVEAGRSRDGEKRSAQRCQLCPGVCLCVRTCACVQVGCVAPPSFRPCFPSEVAADDT